MEKKRHENIRKIIDDWLTDVVFERPSSYPITTICDFEVCGRNVYVYTNRPGILIGRRGEYVNKLQDTLTKNGVNKKVHILDLGLGGYVREVSVKRKLW